MIFRKIISKALVRVLLFLGVALLSIVIFSCSEQEQSNAVVLADVPMLEDSRWVVVPVTINSQDYRFFVDTASGSTGVDIKLKSLLGDFIKKQEGTITPEKIPFEYETYKIPKRFKLGSLSMAGEIDCYDLSKGPLPPSHNYHGVIGMNCLQGKVLQFDLENKRVRLLRWRKGASPSVDILMQKWGHSIPMITNELGYPQIHLNLTDTITELFAVDTGLDSHNYLRESTFDKLIELDGVEYHGKEDVQAKARSQGIEFKPEELREIVLINQISLSGIDLTNQHFSRRRRSILGIRFVRVFRMMTFDFENNILYLKPPVADSSGNKTP